MFSLKRIFLLVAIVDADSLSSLLSTVLLRLLIKTLSTGGAVGVTGIDIVPVFVGCCVSGSSGIESRRSSSYLELRFYINF